jgi:predicted dehydrogenase
MTYKAAVIGAGMIGAKMDTPGAFPPQTHAGGYAAHDGFELVALCDPHTPPGLKNWGCQVYHSSSKMLKAHHPDIVSVAVPVAEQPALLQQLADFGVKAVIAEKPFAPDLETGKALASLFAQREIPLIVNYSRRFVPLYSYLKQRFETEQVLTTTIKYGKGLMNNGSHAIDILRFLFGDCLDTQPLAARNDNSEMDPSYAVFMRFARSPITFLEPLDDRLFTHFEIDIVTDMGRWQINNDHRDCHSWIIEDNTGIPPGRRIREQRVIPTGHERAILNLLDNAKAVLDGHAAPLCRAEDAVQVQEIIESIRVQARRAGLG